MTDEEILKAFECCCGDDVNGTHCKDCPAEKYNFDWCSDEVLREMVVYIKRLKAENAALRERLEKAVKFPCKVGDILYTVTFSLCDGYDDCGNRLYNSGWNILKEKVTEKNFYRMCDFVRNGKAFFSEEGAKVRLKELQGGGK